MDNFNSEWMRKNWGWLLLIGVLGLGIYKYFFSTPTTRMDCLKLGSNLRTELCLAELEKNEPTPTITLFPESELLLLSIQDQKMTGNTTYQPNPIFEATLVNKSILNTQNVVLRFKFYKPGKNVTCDQIPADTQYIDTELFIAAGDSKRIKQVVQTPFDTSRAFTWCVDIYAAQLP